MNLFLECDNTSKVLTKQVEWVKGHQEDGKPWHTISNSQSLKLPANANLNIWCDKLAGKAHHQYVTQSDTNVDSSTLKKVISHFNEVLLAQPYN